MTARIITGDCREVLSSMAANSIDACCTDPPYGLEFMGKEWDRLGGSNAPGYHERPRFTEDHMGKGFKNLPNFYAGGKKAQAWHETWAREVYRVLKPGGHMLAFGGTRTHHRLMCAIEDAGFEIRDMPLFLYVFGSGFPKGRRVDNAIIQEARAWLLSERAPFAEQLSGSIRLPFAEERASTALAAARIQPEGVPALLTEIGRADGSRDLTATLLSESQMEHIASNTTLSWSESSGVDFDQMKTSTIATASETTTILQILNSLPWPSTPDYTIEAETLPSGCQLPVCVVVELLNGSGLGLTPIPALTALGNATENSAKRFDGFNVALKPAYEPIVLARKPLIGSVAANVTAWGVGGLNIDGCRIGVDDDDPNWRPNSPARIASTGANGIYGHFEPHRQDQTFNSKGRWPANLILDAESAAVLDELSGERDSGGPSRRPSGYYDVPADGGGYQGLRNKQTPMNAYGDSGGASRYFFIAKPDSESRLFYTAKASRRERNKGLAGMPERTPHPDEPNGRAWDIPGSHSTARANHHPTVKPIDLMQWLVRLITPKGGTVLDCFCGSGTTGIAADREGMNFIGIEQSEEYAEIARRRIIGDCPLFAEVES